MNIDNVQGTKEIQYFGYPIKVFDSLKSLISLHYLI